MAFLRIYPMSLGLIGGLGVLAGCAGPPVRLPAGQLPQTSAQSDTQTAVVLASASAVEPPPAPRQRSTFDLPERLPGGERKLLQPPLLRRDAPIEEREQKVLQAYPRLKDPGSLPAMSPGAPLSLSDLQQLALEHSPVIQKAVADADAVYGRVIQAGLYPNPTVGYQADQWQPGPNPKPINNNGQQGGFINQLIKTAGKLTLAQQVAGFDYINALVAVRKAQVDVMAQVRANYFLALVAEQSVDVNRRLVEMTDHVYGLQLKQVAAGEAAGYEGLQLYAQAVQSRNSLLQAENAYRSAWVQLVSSIGQPNMPMVALSGHADVPAPKFDFEQLKAQLLQNHTDILTSRNQIAQAQQNIYLQRRLAIPDLQFNNYQQYDNVAQKYQFGVSLAFSLPISDRNQGNVRAAVAEFSSASRQLTATENRLIGSLAEAEARYRANMSIAENYRYKVLPSLTQAYEMLVHRWNTDDPGKVSFNDIVVAQQNLAQAIQTYLTAMSSQWQAVVDIANISQLDDLYPSGPAAESEAEGEPAKPAPVAPPAN